MNFKANTCEFNGFPEPIGLYHPDQEKDSCGVGFITNIGKERSHEIVADASTILCNMIHRGGGYDQRQVFWLTSVMAMEPA